DPIQLRSGDEGASQRDRGQRFSARARGAGARPRKPVRQSERVHAGGNSRVRYAAGGGDFGPEPGGGQLSPRHGRQGADGDRRGYEEGAGGAGRGAAADGGG